MKHEEIIQRSNDAYSKAIAGATEPFAQVRWGSSESQWKRFTEIHRFMAPKGVETVLDVGCGNAEFFLFLKSKMTIPQYAGYDVSPQMVESARQRFPGIDVQRVDIVMDEATRHFDHVVMSGLLNVDCGQDEEWAFRFIEKMFQLI